MALSRSLVIFFHITSLIQFAKLSSGFPIFTRQPAQTTTIPISTSLLQTSKQPYASSSPQYTQLQLTPQYSTSSRKTQAENIPQTTVMSQSKLSDNCCKCGSSLPRCGTLVLVALFLLSYMF